jgi:hypothetical protein
MTQSMYVTNSDCDRLSQFNENNQIETKTDDFASLLPTAIRIVAKTISQDLIFASKEEIDVVKNKLLTENRDGKIESIINDKEFNEKRLEDDPEYQKLIKRSVTQGPSGQLFYLDYKYDDLVKRGKKTRRSVKKNKK